MKRDLPDIIETLVKDVLKNVSNGYYDNPPKVIREHQSLKDTILGTDKVVLISELKFASPSAGALREGGNPVDLARAMLRGGASALSVVTEPTHFNGSIKNLSSVASQTSAPLIMKDIIVTRKQIEAAPEVGADAILLIASIYLEHHISENLEDLIEHAHSMNLEVILETHSENEFRYALQSEADMVGINNRDLKTFNVTLDTTRKILENIDPSDRLVISESGIKSPEDIRSLHQIGVRAFLVGSSIMTEDDVEGKVQELVTSI